MVTAAGHSHRSTTKHSHKSFKSRFASKGALKAKSKGLIPFPLSLQSESIIDTPTVGKSDENPGRKTPHQQVLSKLERRNKARQIAANKHRETLRAEKIFDGRRGAPRIVAVIPLSEDCNAADAVRKLNASLDIDVEVPESGIFTVGVERFKQKVQYVMPRRREFLDTLDACKLADFVVFILSANQEVDGHGESLLRGIEGQGISNVITVVQHLDTVEPAKRRPDVKKSLLSYIKHFFPTEAKVHSLDTFQEAQNALRSLCTQHPRGVNWRDARSYLLAEEVRWDVMEGLIIGGTVRGRGLKADRLVHIQGYGDFRIKKVYKLTEYIFPGSV